MSPNVISFQTVNLLFNAFIIYIKSRVMPYFMKYLTSQMMKPLQIENGKDGTIKKDWQQDTFTS